MLLYSHLRLAHRQALHPILFQLTISSICFCSPTCCLIWSQTSVCCIVWRNTKVTYFSYKDCAYICIDFDEQKQCPSLQKTLKNNAPYKKCLYKSCLEFLGMLFFQVLDISLSALFFDVIFIASFSSTFKALWWSWTLSWFLSFLFWLPPPAFPNFLFFGVVC